MKPIVLTKRPLPELEEIAWAHFIRLLGNEQIPEDDAKRVTVGAIISPGRPIQSLTLKVCLLPTHEPEEEMTVDGYPIDNYLDTKALCLLQVDRDTAKVTVTIINEMPWLRQDMLD